MRKKNIWLGLLYVAMGSAAFCSGCGGTDAVSSNASAGTASSRENEAESTAKTEAVLTEDFNMDDIDWSVEAGIVDGERYVLLNYTNNSPYTIASLQLSFAARDDLTEEEIETYYSDMQSKYEMSDEDMEEFRQLKISMWADSEKIVQSGEGVNNEYVYYYTGYYYVLNIDHYNLVTPDIATIRYVDGEVIRTVYYDFLSGNYTYDSDIESAYEWVESELGDQLPKPDVSILKKSHENESSLGFEASGISLEDFNAYVTECKSFGYTEDASSSDGSYSADSSNGYHIRLYYYDSDGTMSISLSVPEDTEETTEGSTAESIAETAGETTKAEEVSEG